MVRSVEADGLRWGACESTCARHSENYELLIVSLHLQLSLSQLHMGLRSCRSLVS